MRAVSVHAARRRQASASAAHRRAARRCRGVSMVEALVAALIVAIGLMGVAGLIVESLQNGHGALLRTQAVNLVSDMQERIRANPLGADAYDCAQYASGPSLLGCAPSGASPGGVNCTAARVGGGRSCRVAERSEARVAARRNGHL